MSQQRQRIDKWLFFARMVKSRSLAARFVEEGRVRIDGDKISQPSRNIRPGDVLTLRFDRSVRIIRVLGIGERRGPYRQAVLLYDELGESMSEKRRDESTLAGPMAQRAPGAGRPTKKERRQVEKLTSNRI